MRHEDYLMLAMTPQNKELESFFDKMENVCVDQMMQLGVLNCDHTTGFREYISSRNVANDLAMANGRASVMHIVTRMVGGRLNEIYQKKFEKMFDTMDIITEKFNILTDMNYSKTMETIKNVSVQGTQIAAMNAARGLVVRDLIDDDNYTKLTAAWRSVVGPIC